MSAGHCPYCSSPVAAGARFCRACGAEQGPAGEPPHQAAYAGTRGRHGGRRGVTVLLVLVVVLVFGVAGGVGGYFLLVSPGQDDRAGAGDPGSEPTPEDQEAAATTPDGKAADGYRLAQRSGFSIQVPASWRLTEDEVDKGYGIRNTWNGPDGASVLVDYTRDFDGTSEGSARKLRRNASKLDGYDELSFRRVTLGDNEMLEWHFVEGGEEKVDYFTDSCGTGYAVLGAAPADVFDRFADDFRHAAESLKPDC